MITRAPAVVNVDGVQAAPDWVRGATPPGDAAFLRRIVTVHAPARVLELGVAAGVSSAYLLEALDALPDVPGGRELRSCDVQATCYFDAGRATGEAVATMYPRPRARWVLDTNTDARRLSQTLAPGSVDLVFIDANHFHPWPLLDLLHLSAIAAPGAWFVLHDINLPAIAPRFAAWGATWLFETWPFQKCADSPDANIGAVRLPADPAWLTPWASTLLERPWEHTPTRWHVALPAMFAALEPTLAARLEPFGAS